MGYSLQVSRIDFPRLLRVPGSRDHKLLATVRPELEDLWDPDDFDEEDPPLAMPPEALEQIVNGQVPDEEWGGEPYYEALAALYAYLGISVGELHLSSHDMKHIQEVEEALSAAGAKAPLSLQALVLRGAPIRVPSGEPFPCLGYLSPEEVAEARVQYDALSLQGVPPGLRSTIEQLGAWLKKAKERGEGLVGVLS